MGYAITPDFNASIGYYYQSDRFINGSGLLGRLGYNIAPGLTLGINYSYDVAFESRVSGDIKYRFGGNGFKTQSEKKAWQTPVMQALTDSVKHRDVRVHDCWTGAFSCVTIKTKQPRKCTTGVFTC